MNLDVSFSTSLFTVTAPPKLSWLNPHFNVALTEVIKLKGISWLVGAFPFMGELALSAESYTLGSNPDW